MSIESLVEEIKKVVDKIIIVNVIERRSPGYYNYKTRYIAIYVPPIMSQYEEQDILQVKTYSIYCGVYQDIEYCEELITRLKELGFTIIER